MKKEIDIDFEKYFETFYQKEFSAYDFLLLFNALNACNDTMCFNKDELLEFIGICKKNEIYLDLLNDIKIKSNGIFNYSNDLEEAIGVLKWAGVLFMVSPEKDGKVYFCSHIPTIDIIESRLKFLNEMILFVCDFEKYQLAKKGLMSKAHPDQIIIKRLLNNRK